MDVPHPRATAAIAGHPIHAMLVPFPIVCFTLTLLTDIAYWQTSNLMWLHFSEWLLLAGVVFGGFAALAGAVDMFRREVRSQRLRVTVSGRAACGPETAPAAHP